MTFQRFLLNVPATLCCARSALLPPAVPTPTPLFCPSFCHQPTAGSHLPRHLTTVARCHALRSAIHHTTLHSRITPMAVHLLTRAPWFTITDVAWLAYDNSCHFLFFIVFNSLITVRLATSPVRLPPPLFRVTRHGMDVSLWANNHIRDRRPWL